MRRKEIERSAAEPCGPLDELRCELERLGLAPSEAAPLAEQLVRLARELPEREYRALFDGVIRGQRAGREPTPKGPELQSILQDFAAELKKLDEGLRLLTAYLVRLRDQTLTESSRTLH